VIVRDEEKPYLEDIYATLKHSENDKLEFENIGEGLSRLKEKNGHCPMFTEDRKCSVHATKPLDCLLWPTMFAVDKANGPIALDVKCPATRSAKIPIRFYELADAVKEFLSAKQKKIYAQENRDSYFREGRIINVQALGPENAQEVLCKWDNIKKPIEEAIDRIWQTLEYKLNPLRYDSEDVLSVFKWILAIAIWLCIEHSFKLSYQVFLSDWTTLTEIENNRLYNFIFGQFEISPATFIGNHNGYLRGFAVVTLALFLFDAFRVLVPLPWIFKNFRKRSLETGNPQSFRLPAFDVSKLGFISVVTIYVFFFAAQTFVLLNVYFMCLAIAHSVNLFWYLSLSDRCPFFILTKNITAAVLQKIERQESGLKKKLTGLVRETVMTITNIQENPESRVVATPIDATGALVDVLRHDMKELEGSNKRRAENSRNRLPELLNKWQEYLEAKDQIIGAVRVPGRWRTIALWDFFSCLAVLSPLLPLHAYLPARLLLWLVAAGGVSHIANIIYDYYRNHDEYYSTLMLLYRPVSPSLTQKKE
jgi:Fe-S-cluster containining protein